MLSPFALWFFRKNINYREGVSFVAAALSFISVLSMVPAVLRGSVWSYTLVTFFPGVSLRFAVDGLSLIFGLVATFLWFFATCYNIGYMRTLKEHAQTRYYFCFALAIFGAVGVAFSGTIVTLYLFYEVITVCTYPAGRPPSGRGRLSGRPQVSGLSHGHEQALSAAGHDFDLRSVRHPGL